MEIIEINGPIIDDELASVYEWYGVTATAPKDIRKRLKSANGQDIDVYINSGGGIVDSGSEIYSRLKEYQGNVTVKIVGLAGSAASVIAMSGDKVMMSPTGRIMIHNSSILNNSNKEEMESYIERLKVTDSSIADSYQLKTGLPKEKILEMMKKETWMGAKEALSNNFIDEIMFQNEDTPIVMNYKNHSGLLSQEVINKGREQMAKENLKDSNKINKVEVEIMEEKSKELKLKKDEGDEKDEGAKVVNGKTAEEIRNNAIKLERDRVSALNKLKNIPGSEDIIERAISDGSSVEEAAMEIANSEEVTNIKKAMNEKGNIKKDLENSGAVEVEERIIKAGTDEEKETLKMVDEISGMRRNKLKKVGGR